MKASGATSFDLPRSRAGEPDVHWRGAARLVTMALPGLPGKPWRVLISCPSKSWRTARGRIRRDCLLAEDGVDIALLLDTKATIRPMRFWKPAAISATPTVARGRPPINVRMPCASGSLLLDQQSIHQRLTTPARCCGFVSFANEITAPKATANLNSIWPTRPGCAPTKICAYKRWPNVSWRHTCRRKSEVLTGKP